MIGMYQPGSSPLHRMPAGLKLIALCLLSTAAMLVDSPRWLAAATLVALLGYPLARISGAVVWRLVRPMLTMVALVVLLQGLLGSWQLAAQVGLRVLLVLTLANLLTLTTPTSALIDAFERGLGPLRRFGVRPERIGLLVSLVLRFIPVLLEQAQVVRQAQQARGVRGTRAFLVPLVIRTIRMADGLGDALEVRGFAEDTAPDDRRTAVAKPSISS